MHTYYTWNLYNCAFLLSVNTFHLLRHPAKSVGQFWACFMWSAAGQPSCNEWSRALSIGRPSGLIHYFLLLLPACYFSCCEQVSCVVIFPSSWKYYGSFCMAFLEFTGFLQGLVFPVLVWAMVSEYSYHNHFPQYHRHPQKMWGEHIYFCYQQNSFSLWKK